MSAPSPDTPATRYLPSHIAGNPQRLTQRQRELIALAASLGPKFAERAPQYDREASFPFENYEDLRRSGLLALCVPAAYGGLDADFESYVMVSAELGRWCGSTALSFNMHVCSTLWSGAIADALEMTPEQRAEHHRIRTIHYERIVQQGKVYAQPFSEGGAAAAGAAPWGTVAMRVAISSSYGLMKRPSRMFTSSILKVAMPTSPATRTRRAGSGGR